MIIKKKKIGIVTITNDGYNFGNRLQNYALQTIVRRLGFEVETLNRPILCNQRLWFKQLRQVLHYIIPYHQKIEHIIAGNFFLWNEKYIQWSPVVIDDNVDFEYIRNRYDCFIAGSDQIWNPKFRWGTDSYMFLQFAHPEQRVAYAPSIGLDAVEDSFIPQYKEWWKDWKALSCRERKGSKIIENIVGKRILTLIDPTLLLTQQEWRKLTHCIKTPRKYIVVYMLGEITGEHKQYLENISCESHCDIVDVMNDIRYAGCNPSKFVALIQHAERVVSDSYHALVFSLLFHRPFTFIDRVGWGMNMNSRIETLMEMFDIKINKLETITEMTIDWILFEQNIGIERKKAIDYLKAALQ